jgi:hypothetical protein
MNGFRLAGTAWTVLSLITPSPCGALQGGSVERDRRDTREVPAASDSRKPSGRLVGVELGLAIERAAVAVDRVPRLSGVGVQLRVQFLLQCPGTRIGHSEVEVRGGRRFGTATVCTDTVRQLVLPAVFLLERALFVVAAHELHHGDLKLLYLPNPPPYERLFRLSPVSAEVSEIVCGDKIDRVQCMEELIAVFGEAAAVRDRCGFDAGCVEEHLVATAALLGDQHIRYPPDVPHPQPLHRQWIQGCLAAHPRYIVDRFGAIPCEAIREGWARVEAVIRDDAKAIQAGRAAAQKRR